MLLLSLAGLMLLLGVLYSTSVILRYSWSASSASTLEEGLEWTSHALYALLYAATWTGVLFLSLVLVLRNAHEYVDWPKLVGYEHAQQAIN